jgi:hypothetical protein
MALLLTSVFGVTGCGSDDGEAPVESRVKNAAPEASEASGVSDALSKADCEFLTDDLDLRGFNAEYGALRINLRDLRDLIDSFDSYNLIKHSDLRYLLEEINSTLVTFNLANLRYHLDVLHLRELGDLNLITHFKMNGIKVIDVRDLRDLIERIDRLDNDDKPLHDLLHQCRAAKSGAAIDGEDNDDITPPPSIYFGEDDKGTEMYPPVSEDDDDTVYNSEMAEYEDFMRMFNDPSEDIIQYEPDGVSGIFAPYIKIG